MNFIRNFPLFSILLCMVAGIFISILKPKAAKYTTVAVVGTVLVLSIFTLSLSLRMNQSFTFMMGHVPAPWGNEIRIGKLEALMMTVFSAVIFVSLIAGFHRSNAFVSQKKLNLYCIMIVLALAAIQVMVYTNDLFTAYVFIEIMTIASCALIMVRQNGHTLVATTRYMIMNLLASGLVLFGIAMLYGITGHLLMEPLSQSIRALHQSGEYKVPLTVVIALITAGLSIKSAMFPFHNWAPDAYAFAPPMSSAILSGVISKSYIFLLIKFYLRVIGLDIIIDTQISTFLFYFGMVGMLAASIMAIAQKDIRRMVSYSSVSQIAFIYMGLGLATHASITAAIFQMLAHATAKSLLFLSTYELINVSGDRKRFRFLHGAASRCVPAGIVFTVGALSMVGIPFTGGFIAKISMALSAMPAGGFTRNLVLIALALSTLLSAVYYLHTVVSIYRKAPDDLEYPTTKPLPKYAVAALFASMLMTIYLGVGSGPVLAVIEAGLKIFV